MKPAQITVSSWRKLPLQWQLLFFMPAHQHVVFLIAPRSWPSAQGRFADAGTCPPAPGRSDRLFHRVLFRPGLSADGCAGHSPGAGSQSQAKPQGSDRDCGGYCPDPSSGQAAFRCTMGGTWPLLARSLYLFVAGCAQSATGLAWPARPDRGAHYRPWRSGGTVPRAG